MATSVTLPKEAVTEFDLPRVCVATGATEGVEYKRVKFSFVPMWARMSVAFCGLIGVVLMMMNTRRVEAEVPFTAEAWSRWQRAKIIPAAIILGGIPLIFLPILVDPDFAPIGFIAFFAAVIAGVVYAATVTKSAGPICKNIDEGTITLDIPSAEAAEAIEARLAGAPAPTRSTAAAPTVF